MRIFLFLTILILAGCGAQPPIKVPNPIEIEKLEFVVDSTLPLVQQAYSIESEVVCVEHNGQWKKVGKQQQYSCVLATRDGGKACSSNKECEVGCVAENNDAVAGQHTAGVCLENTDLFGCRAYVSNGVVEPTLCVD